MMLCNRQRIVIVTSFTEKCVTPVQCSQSSHRICHSWFGVCSQLCAIESRFRRSRLSFFGRWDVSLVKRLCDSYMFLETEE